ncbi:hypothetical protein [Agrobacterium sp. LAD9]|uniref:hypothetical protein n=1 Tax=Agrobacterium sp. LAD9 TaxID=2055153 RepID=UPI000D1DA833|nr:hypothetical protein [Agrobacterium sp. LAD9]
MKEISVEEGDDNGAKEREVRDYYAQHLGRARPHEHLAKKEQGYVLSRLRADMRTIDLHDTIREWEFKLHADYRAIGQILTYVALARKELGFRAVRGVVAAFSFADEVSLANEVMNLNLELVTLPDWMRGAGNVTGRTTKFMLPKIPNIQTRARNDNENS